MNIDRSKHNRYTTNSIYGNQNSGGISTDSSGNVIGNLGYSGGIIQIVGGGGSGSGGGTIDPDLIKKLTNQDAFSYMNLSASEGSIAVSAKQEKDYLNLKIVGADERVSTKVTSSRSLPATEYDATGSNSGKYTVSYLTSVITDVDAEGNITETPVYTITIVKVSDDSLYPNEDFNRVELRDGDNRVGMYTLTDSNITVTSNSTTGLEKIVIESDVDINFTQILFGIADSSSDTIATALSIEGIVMQTYSIVSISVSDVETTELWKLDDDGKLFSIYDTYVTKTFSVAGDISTDKSIKAKGDIHTDKGYTVGDFVTNISGGCFQIVDESGDTYAEMDSIRVRKKAHFETLEIVNVNSISGKQIISPGGAVTLRKVDILASVYRCYFLGSQDGVETENRFRVNDLAYSQNFNITNSGQFESATNHYWWAKVVGVSSSVDEDGNHYIDISKVDRDGISDIPHANDIVAQLGNTTDADRQSALIFSAVDSDAPRLLLCNGINTYTLSSTEYFDVGVDHAMNQAYMNVYGDAYIGDKGMNTYLQFTQANGLKIKGTISATSNFDGKPFDEVFMTNEKFSESVLAIVGKDLEYLQNQIDGNIESWFYPYSPEPTNYPANTWITELDRQRHVGDTFTNIQEYIDDTVTPDAGKSWRWVKNTSNVWLWTPIADSDAVLALKKAGEAQDTADGKRRIFTRTPITSDTYDIGDLWVNAIYSNPDGSLKYNNDLLRAGTAKVAGQMFQISHWDLASKYTDDKLAEEAKQLAEQAKKDVEKANQAISDTNASVNDLNGYVDGAFKDGIIDNAEAVAIEKYINTVNKSKSDITATYEVLYNNIYLQGSAKIYLSQSYTKILTAITNLLDSINIAISDKITTVAEKEDVDAKFALYNTAAAVFYNSVEAANTAIQDKLKEYSDAAKDLAEEAKRLAAAAQLDADKANAAIKEVDKNVGDLSIYIDEAFKDGIITNIEAASIEKYKNIINTSKLTIDSTYAKLYANVYLSGNAKSNLYAAYNSVISSITNLLASIQTAIADGITTVQEKEDVDTKFALYNTASATFYTRVEEANNAIQNKLKELIDDAAALATAAQKAAEAAGKAANDLKEDLGLYKNEINDVFQDGIITASEKNRLKTLSNTIRTTTLEVYETYIDIYNNVNLAGKPIQAKLQTDYNKYAATATTLINTVDGILERVQNIDYVITKGDISSVDTAYASFNNAYAAYIQTLNEANFEIASTIGNNAYSNAVSKYAWLNGLFDPTQVTTIEGGMVTTGVLALGKTTSGTFTVNAGISGIMNDSYLGKGPALWFGGDMLDKDNYTPGNRPANVATSVIRFDGSGYLGYKRNTNASKDQAPIWWDNTGNIHANPLSFFVGEETVGLLLASFHAVDTTGDGRPDYVEPKVPFNFVQIGNAYLGYDSINNAIYVYTTDSTGAKKVCNFYAYGEVSAYGSSEGGDTPTGVDYLKDLLDVTITSASDGQVLTYQASTGKWINKNAGTGGLSTFTVKLGTVAYNSVNGVVSLPAYPNVYAWALAATKPTYTASEVGAPSLTGTGASGTWGINITGNAATLGGLPSTSYLDRTVYNYANGITVKTSIAQSSNRMIFMRITGNGYNSMGAIDTVVQCYAYTGNSFTNSPAMQNNGYRISYVKAFYYNNLVYFYIPLIGNYQSVNVYVSSTMGGDGSNLVTALTNEDLSGSGSYVYTIDPANSAYLTDNVASATKLQTPRTISLTGDITGSVSFDGSANVSLPTTFVTTNFDNRYVNKTGDTMTGGLTINSASNVYPISINSTGIESAIRMYINGVIKGYVGYTTAANSGAFLYSSVSGGHEIAITDSGLLNFGTRTAKYTVWHAGNDGNGSGLDADLLDGVHNGSLTASSLNNITSVTDANQGQSTGAGYNVNGITCWRGTNAVTNTPPASNAWLIVNFGMGGNYGTAYQYASQFYFGTTGNDFHFRKQQGGTFYGWRTLAFLDSNVASAAKLQTARTIWGQSFDGTGNVNGTLLINGTEGSYTEGIRIKQSPEGWATILLGGNDLTADTGTSVNSWSIHNNNGSFYINKNSASGNTGNELCNVGGNWGVGTTSPAYKLHINGSARSATMMSTNFELPYEGTGTIIGSYNGLFSGNGDNASYSTHNLIIRSWYGIGIRGNDNVCRLVINARSGDISTLGNISAGGALTTGARITSGTDILANGWIRTAGQVGWYNETYSGGIYQTDTEMVRVYNNKVFYNDGMRQWGIGGHRCGLKLYSSANVGLNLANDSYTWGIYGNSNGNFYIGRRNGNVNDSSGSYVITLSASVLSMAGSISANGDIVASGEVTAYSDIRLKSDISNLQYRNRLIPKVYTKDGKRQLGFIAQEVQSIYPELVTIGTDENHYLSLNYGAITAVLASQINIIDDEVTILKREVKELRSQVSNLTQQLCSTTVYNKIH